MQNYVTFETAKALKEAGFPQPLPEQYQFWYTGKGTLTCLSYSLENVAGLMDYMKRGNWAFAPSTTEIMEQLPGFTIGFEESTRQWVVLDWIKPFCEAANPAEAAALAWLKLNGKKQ